MSVDEVKHVSFSVSGEYITDLYRQMTLEGNWLRAVDDLKACLIGMTIDQAVAVLSGQYKIIGEAHLGNVEMVEEDEAVRLDLLEKQHQVYGKIVCEHGQYYKIHSRMIGASGDDLRDAASHVEDISSNFHAHAWFSPDRIIETADSIKDSTLLDRICDSYIAFEDKIFQVQIEGTTVILVGSPCERPPFWFDRKGADLNEIASGKYLLSQIGYSRDFAFAKLGRHIENPVLTTEQSSVLWEAYVTDLKSRIKEQAEKDGYIDICHEDTGEVLAIVPKAPFMAWSLTGIKLDKLAPDWECVSKSGHKLPMDNPYHTDWMLGGDIDVETWYKKGDNDLNLSAWQLRHDIQKKYSGFSFSVLNHGHRSTAEGSLVFPQPGEKVDPDEIAVLPNAGPDYIEAGMSAAALIVKTGGQMSHLITVLRGRDIPIIRPDKESWNKLQEFQKVYIDTQNGSFQFFEL